MPLKDLTCLACDHTWEALIRKPDDLKEEKCHLCGGADFTSKITAPGNYTIGGDNGASVRPKAGLVRKSGSTR